MILSYINRNFTALIHDPDIKYLKKEELKILLKHKYINVIQEDDVIKAICLWVDGQKTIIKQETRKYNATTRSEQSHFSSQTSEFRV